jgi:hypothetical protein
VVVSDERLSADDFACRPREPDSLDFFSRNSLRWKYGLKIDGVGKQGKTGRPHAPRGQNPLFWKTNSSNSGCSLLDLRISDSFAAFGSPPRGAFRTRRRIVYLDLHVRRRHICAADFEAGGMRLQREQVAANE